jgi:phage terminase Nu1 subunit (DNA packaging protein)
VKRCPFPKLSQQKMADFLGIKRERLSWATREGLVSRNSDDSYQPEIVTPAWLKYERSRAAKKSGKSELEKERVRLTRAKADAAERRLAILDRDLISTAAIVEKTKTVCLRIRNKLLLSVPRIGRSCYAAASEKESITAVRREMDILLAELSALKNAGPPSNFEVVKDESVEGSAAG